MAQWVIALQAACRAGSTAQAQTQPWHLSRWWMDSRNMKKWITTAAMKRWAFSLPHFGLADLKGIPESMLIKYFLSLQVITGAGIYREDGYGALKSDDYAVVSTISFELYTYDPSGVIMYAPLQSQTVCHFYLILTWSEVATLVKSIRVYTLLTVQHLVCPVFGQKLFDYGLEEVRQLHFCQILRCPLRLAFATVCSSSDVTHPDPQ